MPTVFNRICAYSEQNKVAILSKQLRSNLGHKAKKTFLKSGIKTPCTLVKSDKKDCYNAQVNYYPDEFTEILDSLVKEFYDNPPAEIPKKVKEIKPVSAPIKTVAKLRKRTPIKGEPVFSSKLLKVK